MKVLDNEFDIADGTFAQFHFAPIASFLMQHLFCALLHREDAGAYLFRRVVENIGFHRCEQFFTQRYIASNGAGFEQRLFFPQTGVLLDILKVTIVCG
ncbi:MAG: hypothetical protein R6W92_01165, partial [Desulfocurvibacter africanus]